MKHIHTNTTNVVVAFSKHIATTTLWIHNIMYEISSLVERGIFFWVSEANCMRLTSHNAIMLNRINLCHAQFDTALWLALAVINVNNVDINFTAGR